MNIPSKETPDKQLTALSLAALGVVFGDIGTSPLYAMRECFHGQYGIAASAANVLGVLSLIFWALLLIVSIKYLGFILLADNEGEGGVLALTALIKPKNVKPRTPQWALVGIGLFAACLMYGDGMITPAISVLSAVEGVQNITPVLEAWIIPATIIILAGLFLIQKRGTAKVGRLFGPIMLLWFCVLAALGLAQIVRGPQVLAAVFPWHGINFLLANKIHGFIVLGAVFLAVTGAEAIYADMGHFGKRPIQRVWFVLVFPSLVLNYFGQGALLLVRPEEAYHPFYALVPDWAMIPMVLLATLATIIASQAIISGVFSIVYQGITTRLMPLFKVDYTSTHMQSQIYIGAVNWMLMCAVIFVMFFFQKSENLAAAYGLAVTG